MAFEYPGWLSRACPGFFIPGCFCCVTTETLAFVFAGLDPSVPARMRDLDGYDPGGDSWASYADMPTPARTYPAGGAVGETGWSFGGIIGTGPLVDTDEYDSVGNSWSSVTDMPSPARTNHGAFTISTDLYSLGGLNSTPTIIADNDAYNTVGDSWASKTNVTVAVYALACAAISGYGYCFAGITGSGTTGDNYEYDPGGDSWSTKTDLPSPTRSFASASQDDTDRAHVCGGQNAGATVIADNDVYDQSGDSWTSGSDIPGTSRRDMASVSFGDESYVFAGVNLGTAYKLNNQYTFSSDTWASKAVLPDPARHSLGGWIA